MPKAPKAKVGENKKAIHPNSRKAVYLARKSHHEHRVSQTKTQTSIKMELQAEKLMWFQSHMDSEKVKFTKDDLAELIKLYLKRFEEELEQIEIVRSIGNRKGQQHVQRQNAISMTLEREKRQLHEGVFEVPDIINVKSLENFRKWTGEIKVIDTIRLKKFSQEDLDNIKKDDVMDEEESAV
ncbi:hypothetical protein FSP39_009181 [Pinctada imbricata]|uniref:Translation machinery-associated protein 16 n=1 Tax=Pinctada imbricata TaxID=66713 RepID=A0AA88XR49_PINIB|nr:hypothetical protein FSP39_009181 [Pinctada imbricata]